MAAYAPALVASALAHRGQRGRPSHQHQPQGRWNMSGNTDEAKGRVKEAAGDLTGDKSLKNEGKTDRAAGKAKDVVDEGADKVKDALRKD
jgi:uncharacterized protein YjbJ (UPF0337 family)